MISFTSITEKLIESLNDVVTSLQSQDLIKQDILDENGELFDKAFKFRIYDNDGEYKASNEHAEYFLKDKKEPTILMCIRPAGGIQDVSLATDLALHILNIEICANIAQYQDIKTILDTFTQDNRSKFLNINGSDCKIEIGEFPIYDPFRKGPILEDSYEELEIFNAHLVVNVTDFLSSLISNNFKFKINDEIINFNTLTWQRKYEQEFDTSEIRTEAKSFSKISTSGFTVELFAQNTPQCKRLIDDIIANNYFGQVWQIELINNGESKFKGKKNFVITDGQVNLAHGKIVSIIASFVPSAD